MSEAMVAQFSAPASYPAKSAFFRLWPIGRMVRSTQLLSISILALFHPIVEPSKKFHGCGC